MCYVSSHSYTHIPIEKETEAQHFQYNSELQPRLLQRKLMHHKVYFDPPPKKILYFSHLNVKTSLNEKAINHMDAIGKQFIPLFKTSINFTFTVALFTKHLLKY